VEAGRKVIVGLRPEHLEVGAADTGVRLPVQVVESTGSMTYVTSSTVPELTVVETRRTQARAGDTIGVTIAPEHVHLFDPDTERTI
jgi:multiple sugar transport system ATP-binding protein